MSDRSRPWSKFYWSDWDSDPALRQCSLAAQGLWMRMLCICSKSDPRGYLTIAGVALDSNGLSNAVGRSADEVRGLLDELSHWGVFSEDRKGRIYSRRMVRDEQKSKEGEKYKKQALSSRAQCIENKEGNPAPSRGAPRGASTQKPEARSQRKEKGESARHTESVTQPEPRCAEPPPIADPPTETAPPIRPVGMSPEARAIVEAFDQTRVEALGPSQARPWPAATDGVIAQRWADAGLTDEVLRPVFAEAHARKSGPPIGNLKYLETRVAEMLAAPAIQGEPHDPSARKPAHPPKRGAYDDHDSRRKTAEGLALHLGRRDRGG